MRQDGDWAYQLDGNGYFKAWFLQKGISFPITNKSGGWYRSELQSLVLPSAIRELGSINILHADVTVAHNNYPCIGALASINETGINYYALSGDSRTASPNYILTAQIVGKIEKGS